MHSAAVAVSEHELQGQADTEQVQQLLEPAIWYAFIIMLAGMHKNSITQLAQYATLRALLAS